MLHAGHIQFLEAAKACGDRLVLAIESDAFIREVKKREPIHTQVDRACVLASLRMVDGVIMLPRLKFHAEYDTLVSSVCPAVIAVTDGDVHTKFKKRQADRVSAELRVVTPRIPELSTSRIITHESFTSSKHTT